MANKSLSTIPLDGKKAMMLIKEKYGSIRDFSKIVGRSDRSVRTYLKNNKIPALYDVVKAFYDLMNGQLTEDQSTGFDPLEYFIFIKGYDAGYDAKLQCKMEAILADIELMEQKIKEIKFLMKAL